VRGAAHLYYNADLLEKANELATRLESMQEAVSEGDRKLIAKVRGRAQQAA
jgi:prephenate dehydrogenase